MNEIGEAITNVRKALASNPDAGPSADRPATAFVEEGLRCRVEGGDGWALVTDMPAPVSGSGSGPTPAWLVRAAWTSCTATAIAMRAAELGVSLTRLEVTAESETDMRGLLDAGDGVLPGPQIARMRVQVAAEDADEELLRELVSWADGHSPVCDALRRAIPVELEIATG